MIKTVQHAIAVQTRRRESGKKGRSKAVRRWFKRTYSEPAIDIYTPNAFLSAEDKDALHGNFTDCELPFPR